MKRTSEFVLGLIGGIFGFIGAFVAIMFGGLDAAFSGTETSSITGLGWSAMLFSTLAIVGCILVKSKPKLGGLFMLIAAIGGTISISMFYVIPGIMLFIAGLMGLIRKDKSKVNVAA